MKELPSNFRPVLITQAFIYKYFSFVLMQPTFVVLTDLSSASQVALTYTANLAALLDGRLVLLHVYQDPLLAPEAVMVAAPAAVSSRQEIMTELMSWTRRLAVPAEAEMSVDTLGLAVFDVVQRRQPLLLTIGREHPGNLLDRFISNLALPVLHEAHDPMLLVPEEWKDTALPSRVVVAADDDPFWLTSPSRAMASLLAVLKPRTTVIHIASTDGPSQAEVGLEAVRRAGMFGSITNNSLYEVREEAPAEGILHAAAELDAQLIVVLARPHTFVGGLFHRSVTAQLLRRSPRPILVLPTAD